MNEAAASGIGTGKAMAPRRQERETQQTPQTFLRRQKRPRSLAWWMSALFLLAAVGVILWFAWTAGLFVSDRPAPQETGKATALDERRIVVRGADIAGLDENGLPFVVSARVSERFDRDTNLVHLTEVRGEMKKSNGETIVFRSDRAVYHKREELVDLRDNVRIASPGRYVLLAPQARIVVRTKELSIDSPLTVRLNDGVIRAQGMRTDKDAERIVFTGRVSARFGEDGGGAAEKAEKGARRP